MNTDKLISCVVEGIEEVKGSKINILNLKSIDNVVCQYFIVCSGNSNTQVNAITNSIKKVVSKKTGEKPHQIEGLENKNWVLLDYIDVVVHIFKKEFREIYNLEELWADAKIIRLDNLNG